MQNRGFEARVAIYRARVEQQMTRFIESRTAENNFGVAVRYAVASEGKRIRPLLAYATAELIGEPAEMADYPAVAIELVHTYSLVHDDLPAMDDDDLRRGRPTVHAAFDEATGILVGDALLTHAFEYLTEADVDPAVVVAWVGLLSRAAGGQGMVFGQAADMAAEGRSLSLGELEIMHRKKSGALIEASMQMVACVADETTAVQLGQFAHHIGLAFQIRDDILDVEATTDLLGKPQGSDEGMGKSTFVSLMGVDDARRRLLQEQAAATAILDGFGADAEGLRWIADFIVARAF